MDLVDWDDTVVKARYDRFSLVRDRYALNVSGYSGNAGNE